MKLTHVYDPKYIFLTTTDRKFRTIELRGELRPHAAEQINNILHRHGSNVVELSLVDFRFDELSDLANILSCLTNLKKLTAFRTWITGDRTICGNGPLLPKLETLQIAACQYDILKCLMNVKLRSLKVINSIYGHSYLCDVLENFLKIQDQLTELALRSVYTSHSLLFNTTNLNDPMPFKLTRLSLLYVRLTDNGQSNLLKFMEKHAKSLIELELGHEFHHTIYECVFTKMTNLKTLNLMMDTIPQQTEMLERFKKNLSVKNLTIKQSPSDNIATVRFFRDFLKFLPNVTNLTVLTDCPKEILEIIADTLTQLKVLQINEYTANFCGVRFPNLNALHIGRIYENIDWQAFSKSHPRLTELTLEFFEIGITELVEDNQGLEKLEKVTRANVHLHKIRFGDWFKADASSFEIVRKNCPNLKVFELNKDCALPDEQYDQLWPDGVLLFRDEGFLECYVQSPFWSGYPYDDEDIWETGDVRDMFDYSVMDMPIVGLDHNMLEASDDSSEDESDRSTYDPWDFVLW